MKRNKIMTVVKLQKLKQQQIKDRNEKAARNFLTQKAEVKLP